MCICLDNRKLFAIVLYGDYMLEACISGFEFKNLTFGSKKSLVVKGGCIAFFQTVKYNML